MHKISCISSLHNEAPRLPKLAQSIAGVDEWIVVDHLSTDDTAKVAKDLGATVYTQGNFIDIVTEVDEKEWERRYGFPSMYRAGNTVPDGSKDINDLISKTHNDWIIYLDGDEVVTWDIQAVKNLLTPELDIILCTFIHTHNPDGSPKETFPVTKLFNKSRTWFQGKIHGCITGNDLRILQTDSMKIDHWQVERDYRATYLPILEYAYLKDQDLRTCFYLAREFFIYGKFEVALQFFKIYLRTAFDASEISIAFTLMSACSWKLGREEEAKMYCLQAIEHNPNSREPYLVMADMSGPKKGEIWKKFASLTDTTQHR